MPLRFQCPGCDQTLQVKEEAAGKRLRCPKCGEVSTAPAAAAILLATWGLYALMAGFADWMAGATNRIFIVLPFLITFFAFVGLMGACAVGGAALASITVEFGKMSKNRSALIPAVISG